MKTNRVLKAGACVIAAAAILYALPGLVYVGGGLLYGASEDRPFAPQWDDALQQVDKIVTSRGLCPVTSRHCLDKDTIYVVGLHGGFRVEIYGISDPAILGPVSQAFISEFHDTPAISHIIINAYAFTRKDAGQAPFLKKWSDGALLDVDMKRG